MVDDDAEVAQRPGHDPDLLDLRDVRESAALTGQGRRGEHLERRVLRAADRDLATQRHAALDAEDLAGHRLGRELPVEGLGVSHRLVPWSASPDAADPRDDDARLPES